MPLMPGGSLSMPAGAAPFRFGNQIRLWQPPRPVVQKLAALSALRQWLRLVGQQLQQPITEQQGFGDDVLQEQLSRDRQTSLEASNTDLGTSDKQMDELIEQADRPKELFAWTTAVPGVGAATATEVVVATDEFKAISGPKKLGCQAGVARFGYKSGSRVRS